MTEPQSSLKLYHLAANAEGKSTWTDKTTTQQVGLFLFFMENIGRETLGDIEPNDCLVWMAALHTALPPLETFTINAYYRAVHAFFEWAVREKLVEESPLKYVKPPKVEAVPDRWHVDPSGKVRIKRSRS